MRETIAIIPARGGSKRIPRKNIIDFNGKPMIAWTIEAALSAGIFSKVLVSTDCEEISEVARAFGAEVPFLRSGNSDDITPVSEATCDALMQSEDYWGVKFEAVAQLMANCPLRTNKDIVDFMGGYADRQVPFLLSCFKFGWMNPWWAFKLDSDQTHIPLFPHALKQRSQDLDDLFCPTGSIWVANSDALKRSRTFYGTGHQFHPISWKAAVDIDDLDDLEFARSVSVTEA